VSQRCRSHNFSSPWAWLSPPQPHRFQALRDSLSIPVCSAHDEIPDRFIDQRLLVQKSYRRPPKTCLSPTSILASQVMPQPRRLMRRRVPIISVCSAHVDIPDRSIDQRLLVQISYWVPPKSCPCLSPSPILATHSSSVVMPQPRRLLSNIKQVPRNSVSSAHNEIHRRCID
jgi:hypothetical protein